MLCLAFPVFYLLYAYGAGYLRSRKYRELWQLFVLTREPPFAPPFAGPGKVPEARVLEVLRENKMNSNYAFEILEDEIKREGCLFSICVDFT